MEGTTELIRWIEEAIGRGQAELPAFPGVATRLVDLLEQPDAEMDDVGSLIAQDQAISAHVLRMANSVIYGGAMPVETVAQAVLRLGFRETAQVAMTAACRSLFSMEDRAELEVFPEVWQALWLESLVCAYGGRLLSRELKAAHGERVFLASMFHNLGGLVVLKVVAHGLVNGHLRSAPDEADLQAAIDQLHMREGARYLRGCNLPDYVVTTAEHHHDLDVPFDGEHMHLHVLRLADGLCQRVGISPFASGEYGPLAEESASLFDLDEARLELVELQFQELDGQLHEVIRPG